ncbi:hypothetical protein BRADI_4g24158v3 [Brachypodium distachyon]|uniref:Uncharacterized protein n=1 Tax=Brachypodium distachyon TaxID=15368 RepID=A0A2K2CPX9_BRADI|nr:hypothetical protein BRADI_4g24158v3 [Brachypodium distachyon]
MDLEELKEYAKQNKDAFSSQQKAAIKKILQKKQKKKKKRARTALNPILGAVMKFHKDEGNDDDDNDDS